MISLGSRCRGSDKKRIIGSFFRVFAALFLLAWGSAAFTAEEDTAGPAAAPSGEAAVADGEEGSEPVDSADPEEDSAAPETETAEQPPEEAADEGSAGDPKPDYLQRLEIGEEVNLTTEQGPFFGIHTRETTGDPQGAVILLPDRGAHPNWPSVVGPLRRALPDRGWTTLSIELPAGEDEPLELRFESRNRIRAAVALLRTQGHERVALAGHGLGAILAADYAAAPAESGVGGLIVVGMGTFEPLGEELRPETLLKGVEIPVLDIYGSRDLDTVVADAELRARIGRRDAVRTTDTGLRRKSVGASTESERIAAVRFRQLRFAGADHSLSGFEELLSKRVRGWLKHHAIETDGPTIPPEFFAPPPEKAAEDEAEAAEDEPADASGEPDSAQENPADTADPEGGDNGEDAVEPGADDAPLTDV